MEFSSGMVAARASENQKSVSGKSGIDASPAQAIAVRSRAKRFKTTDCMSTAFYRTRGGFGEAAEYCLPVAGC